MGSKSPAFKGRTSLLTRELCNIRVNSSVNSRTPFSCRLVRRVVDFELFPIDVHNITHPERGPLGSGGCVRAEARTLGRIACEGKDAAEGWSKRGSQRGHGGVGLNSGGSTRKAPDRTDGCLMLEAVLWENPTYGISGGGGGGWKRGLWRNCEPTSQPKGRGWKPSAYGCARQCSTQQRTCKGIDMPETFYVTPLLSQRNRSPKPWLPGRTEAGNGRLGRKPVGCAPRPHAPAGQFHGLAERIPWPETVCGRVAAGSYLRSVFLIEHPSRIAGSLRSPA